MELLGVSVLLVLMVSGGALPPMAEDAPDNYCEVGAGTPEGLPRAWYMDDSQEDQREEHHRDPPVFVSLDHLFSQTGVLYWKLDPITYESDGQLKLIQESRGYNYTDVINVSPEKLNNYDNMIKYFFEEHLHTDEEIRFITEGSGYFDVRDKEDQWIRVEVTPGDLLIIPAGIYHRFTLDVKNYIKAIRMFKGAPVWTPHNRPVDDMEVRKNYVAEQKAGFVKNCV